MTDTNTQNATKAYSLDTQITSLCEQVTTIVSTLRELSQASIGLAILHQKEMRQLLVEMESNHDAIASIRHTASTCAKMFDDITHEYGVIDKTVAHSIDVLRALPKPDIDKIEGWCEICDRPLTAQDAYAGEAICYCKECLDRMPQEG